MKYLLLLGIAVMDYFNYRVDIALALQYKAYEGMWIYHFKCRHHTPIFQLTRLIKKPRSNIMKGKEWTFYVNDMHAAFLLIIYFLTFKANFIIC